MQRLSRLDDDGGRIILRHRSHDVFRQIHEHRTGTPRPGDMEGLLDRGGQFLDIPDQEVVLGAGPGDAGDIAFLEGVIANQRCRHLSCENDNGNRVGMGGGNARDGIRCPRA